MNQRIFVVLLFCASLLSFFPANAQDGTLFIIGGGSRPEAMVQEMIKLSELDKPGARAVVLPLSSSEPDTSAYYAIRQFTRQGIARDVFHTLIVSPERPPAATDLQAILEADLIYLPGGDQRRFMRNIAGTRIKETVQQAYHEGTLIAGTSAGAAVMSKHMLTGDERNRSEYTGAFRTIEADNMILQPGLGLLPQAIIDQHFVWRMRFNRLLSVIAEHPGMLGIGIDESTAIVVQGEQARVTGVGQVLVLRNAHGYRVADGLLGARNLQLDLLLPGDTFSLTP